MQDCASILDSVAKGTSFFHEFSHGASHPYIPIHSLCTCSTYIITVHVAEITLLEALRGAPKETKTVEQGGKGSSHALFLRRECR